MNESSYFLKSILSDYYVRHQYSIEKNELNDLKQLTHRTNVFSLNLNEIDIKKVLTIDKTVDLTLIQKGKLNAFLYWFEFCNQENNSNESTDTNQFAAISFYDQNIHIDNQIQSKISLKVLFKNDLFHVKFNNLK